MQSGTDEFRELLAFERSEREKLAVELRELKARFDAWANDSSLVASKRLLTQEPLTESNVEQTATATGDPTDENVIQRDPDEDGGSDTDPRDLQAVTRKRLDIGDAYAPNMSIWDAVLFVGHHCQGPAVSGVLVLVWALNIACQVLFCWIVAVNMLTPDVTDTTLDGLLRWRIGVAHNVEFADVVLQTSMAAQLCSEEGKLHLSAKQAGIFDNLDDFHQGGMQLMLLAQFIWTATILKEMNDTFSFARGLYHIGNGKKTRIIMTESDPHPEQRQMVTTPTGSLVSLVTLMMVTRVTSITRARFRLSIIFIVLPRFGIAIALGYVGVLFLGKTSRIEDLVLNAIALAFVNDIDELFFKVFAPRRSQTLLENLEGFPMPHRKARRSAGLFAVMKLALVSLVLLLTYFILLQPFKWRLEQASNILCSGNKDFVYAINKATGMVHVTPSRNLSNWTYIEKILLQVASPTIDADNAWPVDKEFAALSTSDFTQAVVEPSASTIGEVAFDEDYFASIRDLHGYTQAEAAARQSCLDLVSGQSREASARKLQQLIRDTNITKCSDIPWTLCSQPNMTQLRAICPQLCGCDQPPRYTRGYSGFFQSASGGCPLQCGLIEATRNEVLYSTTPLKAALKPGYYSCSDVNPQDFNFERQCVDTDQFSRAQNKELQVCDSPSLRCRDDLDDSDFTARDMCCKCGGGQTDKVGSSLDCVRNLRKTCRNMDLVPFWWLLYVRGLFDHLTSLTAFRKNVMHAVKNDFNVIGVEPSMQDALILHVQRGRLKESLLNGDWDLMPGVPHPRNLTGCEYLTSFEVKALLNIDLCSPGSYKSIRYLCPETCGCGVQGFKPAGPAQPDVYTTVDILQYNNDHSLLDECPAACVLPHPGVTGEKHWDDFKPDDDL